LSREQAGVEQAPNAASTAAQCAFLRTPGAASMAAAARPDDVVELALRRSESPVGGKGARHVAGVAVELAAGVDQAQLAGAQLGVAGSVVQHTGIRARRDDRAVGRALRAVAAELVQQLGLDLVLAHARVRVGTKARAAVAHRARMCAGRDRAGAAQRRQLVAVLTSRISPSSGVRSRRLPGQATPRRAWPRTRSSQACTRACSDASAPIASHTAG
jgi:hypothetical protein